MKQKDKDSMKNPQKTKPPNRNHFSWLPQFLLPFRSKRIPKPLFMKQFAFSLKKRNNDRSIGSAIDATRQDIGAPITTLTGAPPGPKTNQRTTIMPFEHHP